MPSWSASAVRCTSLVGGGQGQLLAQHLVAAQPAQGGFALGTELHEFGLPVGTHDLVGDARCILRLRRSERGK